jgi:hypothetical protein
VPNWPDGSYFWMAAPAVEGTSLYVTGERISRPAGAVEGEYTARFTVGAGDALTYQGNTGGTGCVADCKTMDLAYVPSGAMTHPSAWHVQLGVLPSGKGYDLGTVVSMSHVTGRGWVAYTKRDDITGSTLERLNAWHVTGPWHVATQQWPATPAPGCAWTYSAETHPASPAPPGTMLVSWASNHDDPGTTCDMQPQFTDLPIGSPPPRADGSGCGPPTGGDNRFPLRPRTEGSCPVSHRVSGREVRSMSDLIPAPSADR